MNYQKIFFGVLCISLMLGCSKEGDPEPVNDRFTIPDFRLVGEDIDTIYQYNYDADQEEGELINLTLESNVALEYLELSQVDNLLTFYSFSSGNFSAIQLDAVTGANTSLNNFYTVSSERSILWGSNSESKVFMGYFSPQGTTNYGIRAIDIESEDFTDINIEFGVTTVFQPLYSQGKLILTYRDNLNANKVAVMSTATNSLLSTLDFADATPSIYITEQGDIGIVLSRDNENLKYQVYDSQTLELREEQPFLLDRLFAPGPLDASSSENKLFYSYTYSQPSAILSTPAVYDFESHENSIIDMVGIVREVEQDLDATIVLSAMDYREQARVFLIGYGKQDGNTLEGGVLVVSARGELLDNIALSFAPTYILH